MRAAATAAVVVAAVSGAIDRRAVVARYPQEQRVADATKLDMADVFSLGNGDFVYNVDATGLQTFNESFARSGPQLDLNTMASWGWHSSPAGDGPDGRNRALSRFNWTTYPTPVSARSSRGITLATDDNLTDSTAGWTMTNPHRLGLGQLSLRIVDQGAAPGADPRVPAPATVTDVVSRLDTWAGAFSASFVLAPVAGTDPFCGSTDEGSALHLQCAEPTATISAILFASYGASTGTCPAFAHNPACDAANSTAVVRALCVGLNECTVPSGNAYWGDPCLNTPKTLRVVAHCSSGGGFQPPSSAAPPTAPQSNSTFSVHVDTTVHPDVDLVATRVSCARLAGADGCPVALRLGFSYARGGWGPSSNDWNSAWDGLHATDAVEAGPTRLVLRRTVDDASYTVTCEWDDAAWTAARTGAHSFALTPPPRAAAAIVQLR